MSPAPLAGLGVTRDAIARYVADHPGCVIDDIAAACHITPAGVGQHLTALLHTGRVSRWVLSDGQRNRCRAHWGAPGAAPVARPVAPSLAPRHRPAPEGSAIETVTTQTALLRALQAELSSTQTALDRERADNAALRAELAHSGSGRLVPRDRRARA